MTPSGSLLINAVKLFIFHKKSSTRQSQSSSVLKNPLLQFPDTVPCRKTRFFPTQITKLAVAPMISKIHKQYVPHWKDLKLSFKF